MNIYKIYYHGHEDGSYLFLTHEKEFSFEEFKAIFSTCLKKAKKKEILKRQKDPDYGNDIDTWINMYLSNAIDIMIDKYGFSSHEVDTKLSVSIFTDTDRINIENNKRVDL